MGIAVLAGVIDSLEAASVRLSNQLQNQVPNGKAPEAKVKWESHTPGTVTPISGDPSVPTKFIATVKREESARKLKSVFEELGDLGKTVEVVAGSNLEAVKQADVVLLWCVRTRHDFGQNSHISLTFCTTSVAASPNSHPVSSRRRASKRRWTANCSLASSRA